MNRAEFIELHHGITSLILVILLLSEHVVAQNNDKGRGQSLTPGMSFVLVFFASVFFLTAFTSLCMRQFSNSRFSLLHRSNPTSQSPSLTRERGLDPAVVNMFPTFLYSEVKGHRIGHRALECAVCILEFEDNEILRLLRKCSHVFHPVCIDPWLDLHVTCPLCRANLVPKPGEMISIVTTTFYSDSDCNLSTDHQSISPPPGTGTGTGTDTGICSGTGTGFGSGSGDLIIDITDITNTELIITPMPNQSCPPRSTPRRLKNKGKFYRSHSTGHLFVREVENRERFTLRLPEDVRSQLMKRSPGNSSPVAGVFLSVRSPRKVYRSNSVGNSRCKNYELFDSVGTTSHFLSQANSVRSTGDDYTTSPKSFMRSIKSPLDRLSRGTDKDDGGERSTHRLIPNAQV